MPLVEMLQGEPPYGDQDEQQAMYSIATNGTPTFAPELLSWLSRAFIMYLSMTLCVDVRSRPTAAELLEVRLYFLHDM